MKIFFFVLNCSIFPTKHKYTRMLLWLEERYVVSCWLYYFLKFVQQLEQIRSGDRSLNLLEYIAELVFRHYQDVRDWYEELDTLNASGGNEWLIDWLNDWLIDWMIDWLIDWLVIAFYAVSAMFQSCNGGRR